QPHRCAALFLLARPLVFVVSILGALSRLVVRVGIDVLDLEGLLTVLAPNGLAGHALGQIILSVALRAGALDGHGETSLDTCSGKHFSQQSPSRETIQPG